MIRKIIVSLFILVLSISAWGQEPNYWKKHSFELSTGYPLYNPTTEYVPLGREGDRFSSFKPVWPLNVTLSYSYRFSKHWAAGARFNTQGWFYKEYTEDSIDEGKLGFDTGGLAPALFVRLYWLNREWGSLYSSLGAGINLRSNYRFSPDIILIGIQGGRKPVYFLSELSFGLSGIGVLVGLGVRIP